MNTSRIHRSLRESHSPSPRASPPLLQFIDKSSTIPVHTKYFVGTVAMYRPRLQSEVHSLLSNQSCLDRHILFAPYLQCSSVPVWSRQQVRDGTPFIRVHRCSST